MAPRQIGSVTPAAPAPRSGIRSQILEAALAEFAEHGYSDASLAAIARKLGVTAPLVLYHFGSKANLWREAVEILCAGLASVVESAVEDGVNLEARSALRLLVRRLVYFLASHPAAYRLLRDQGGSDADRGEWLAVHQLRPIVARIESVYRRAVDEHAVRPAPFETTLFMLLGAASCYLESRTLVSHLFGKPVQATTGNEGAEWMVSYADQVLGLCFEGLGVAAEDVWHVGGEQLLTAVA